MFSQRHEDDTKKETFESVLENCEHEKWQSKNRFMTLFNTNISSASIVFHHPGEQQGTFRKSCF
jgi:hypothetical protein